MTHEDPEGALDVFAEWLALRGTGEARDLDELCRAHPALEAELRRLQAAWQRVAPLLALRGLSLAPEGLVEVLERLRTRAGFERYVVQDEVARGGMGAVRRVWDVDLKRELAMKLLLEEGDRPETAAGGSSRLLARFLEEAQIAGRLDHPSIVPVHELGVDPSGRLYFTMRLVRGEDLSRILARVREGDPEWTQTRVLHVLLKACEALAYAHAKGIIHRDVKPANVMVGGFGEVYVMDWGLAKAGGSRDARDVRVRPPPGGTEPGAARPSDAPLLTMDGDVVGTPAYMSPEQARGDLAAMGPWSDVYSVGAILYHLLAGHAPYGGPPWSPGNVAVWQHLCAGPPQPIAELAPEAPAELLAICEKTMARDPAARYGDVQELSQDLRALLENRVVQAYRSGPVAELQKWVRRNRALSASVAAAVLLALAGLASTTSVQAAGRRTQEQLNLRLAAANGGLERSAAEALRERDAAERAADFLVELFEAPDPAVSLGAPPTAEELLERGAARLDDADFLGTDPLVKARLLDATGRAFGGLGRYERAEALLAEALRLRMEIQGPAHPDALRTTDELALARGRLGRTEEAVQAMEEACARAHASLGALDLLTLELENGLGGMLQLAGRVDEAARHMEASLAGRRALLGDAHKSTLLSLNALAGLEVVRGRYARAEELFSELFQRLQDVQGEDHPLTLVALNNLATLRVQLGRREEALALFREGVDASRRVLGDDHPEVLVSWNNLARLLQRMHGEDEARSILEEQLPRGRALFGSDHPRVVPMIQSLGALYLEAGRLAEAEELLGESLERCTRLRGPDHPETLSSLCALGRLRLRQGRLAEAEEHFACALAGFRASFGPASKPALAALNNVALGRSRLGRTEEAAALYGECLAAARAAYGDASPSAWVPWRNLVRVDLCLGRFEEAAHLSGELLEATPPNAVSRPLHEELRALALRGDAAAAPPEEDSPEGG